MNDSTIPQLTNYQEPITLIGDSGIRVFTHTHMAHPPGPREPRELGLVVFSLNQRLDN